VTAAERVISFIAGAITIASVAFAVPSLGSGDGNRLAAAFKEFGTPLRIVTFVFVAAPLGLAFSYVAKLVVGATRGAVAAVLLTLVFFLSAWVTCFNAESIVFGGDVSGPNEVGGYVLTTIIAGAYCSFLTLLHVQDSYGEHGGPAGIAQGVVFLVMIALTAAY
jgi:hypothetical protein